MLTEFQESVLRATIAEMRRVLDDPETNTVDHAMEAAVTIGDGPDDTVEADLNVGSLPPFGPPSAPTLADPDTGTFAISFSLSTPATVTMRLTNSATATLHMRDQESGELTQPPLSPEDQETVDRYATAAAFSLTGVANGELMTIDPYSFAESADTDEILEKADELLDNLTLYVQALHQRCEQNTPAYGQPGATAIAETAGTAISALTDTLSGCSKQLQLISAFIKADPFTSRWDPVQLDL